MRQTNPFVAALVLAVLLLGACSPAVQPAGQSSGQPARATTNPRTEEPVQTPTLAAVEPPALATDYEIVTLLPQDAIPAIFDPQFVTGEEAASHYAPDELVLGVEIDGDARAYSIPYLSGHEIVNDVVAGQPIAVTW